MLVLTRRSGESVTIGDDVIVKVIEIQGGQVRLGIDAPPTTPVHREEVLARIREEMRQASQPGADIATAAESLKRRGRKR